MKPVIPQITEIHTVINHVGDDYITLPSCRLHDSASTVITEWEFDEEEIKRIMQGERLRLSILTFDRPLQPVKLEITSEDM